MLGYAKNYNNPYKLTLFLDFMEKYYLVERVKDYFVEDNLNLNVLKKTGEKLEVISSSVIKPEEIGIKSNKGNIFCIDNKYKIKEISEEEVIQTLEYINKNYSSWQENMSNQEEECSSHLRFGGNILF